MIPESDRLRRIQLLSSRFRELQGLRVALIGASLAFVVGAYVLLWPQPTNNGTILAVGAAFLPTIAAMPWVSRYYATNFGRKVMPKHQISWWWLFVFAIYNAVTFWVNARFPGIPSGAPTVWTVSLLSVFVAIRDWPWRSYYLLAPVATGIAFAATFSAGGTFVPGLTLPIIFLALGASMVVIGLLDHFTLVRLVREAREPGLAVHSVRTE